MTIKELEQVLALPRATVRFYEQEGLLTPARGPNGYRDYSEADLARLKKIKLLRRLGLEVEAIRQIQAGELSLTQALIAQKGKKEEQRESVEREGAVCEKVAQTEVSYEDLDPEPWLAELEQEPVPAVPAPEKPARQHPWRRYFARGIDLTLYKLPAVLLVDYVLGRLGITLWDFWRALLVDYLGYGLMFLLEPLMLHYLGTTPGKTVFAIRVRDYKGEKLSIAMARWRLKELFADGMGYGIPFYNLIRLGENLGRCEAGEWNSWCYDPQGRLERTTIPEGTGRCWLYGFLCVGRVVASFFWLVQTFVPPQPGGSDPGPVRGELQLLCGALS